PIVHRPPRSESRGKCGVFRHRHQGFHTCGEPCGEQVIPANMPPLHSLEPGKSSLSEPPTSAILAAAWPLTKEHVERVEHPNELTAETVWSDVSARLRGTLNEKTYRNWFGEVTAVSLDREHFVLAVPTDLTREQIERRFAHLMSAGVTDALGSERRLELIVRPSVVVAPSPSPPLLPRSDGSAINPKYTFDSFVIGSSNRFAHAAALAIAEAPAQAYNPLFIYGHTGLGKTHLLHAIANYIGLHSSSLGVRYVTSETFMND